MHSKHVIIMGISQKELGNKLETIGNKHVHYKNDDCDFYSFTKKIILHTLTFATPWDLRNKILHH